MKKSISLVIAILLLLFLSIPSLATPIEAVHQNFNGEEYYLKTYVLAPDSDPAGLIEADFEEAGFLFTHHTTISEERLTEERKSATETVTVETEGKSLEEILKKLPATIPYEEDGYVGILILDTGSISTKAAGYIAKTGTISETREFTGLMYADPSLIPQTVIKDGVTLSLSDISWTVTGTSLVGDSLIPTEYRSTALYSKKTSTQVASGYLSSAIYRGEVTKEAVTEVYYTLTYKGTPVLEPEIVAEEPFPWSVLFKALALFLMLSGGVILLFYLRSRQGVQVFNLIEQDYLCIGRQRLDFKRPVIDLNEFGDLVQSNFFSFVLDKGSSKKLFGRTISVTLGDVTMQHQVREMNGSYRFNLEIGGQLDA